MRKDSGLDIKTLKVDGGASANNFLCQFQSDILCINVIKPRVFESTSLGATYLIGLALDFIVIKIYMTAAKQEQLVVKSCLVRIICFCLDPG